MSHFVRLILAVVILALLLGLAYRSVGHQQEYADKEREGSQQLLEVSDETLAVWREYHSDVGKFKVLFPAYPQHANEVVPVPNTHVYLEYNIYIAEPDVHSSYMVSLITYPGEMDVTNPENILQTVMSEMLQANPLNQLKQVNLSYFEEHPQLEFTIENPEISMVNRAIMVGHTLYLLTVTHTAGEDSNGDEVKFTQSFELLEDGEKAAVHSSSSAQSN